MIRAPLSGLASGSHRLPDDTAHYLVHVRRLREGDSVILFCPNTAREADAVISSIAPDGVEVRVDALRNASANVLPVTLIYAMGKGSKVDQVVQDATELGARTMVVIDTERSVVRLDDARAQARKERWERIALGAARQCGRGASMSIHGPAPLSACPDILASIEASADDALRILLNPHAVTPLGRRLDARSDFASSLVLAIGPEGGFSQSEIEWFQLNGFVDAHVGPRVLRTETVAAAVLGGLQILTDMRGDAP